jgi:hypothetical protein
VPAQALQYVADSRWIAQVAHVLVPHSKHASRVGTVSPQPHRPSIAAPPGEVVAPCYCSHCADGGPARQTHCFYRPDKVS